MTFTFRPANINDAAMLYDLHVATMREAISATWGWDEAWQEQDFFNRFAPERTRIILMSGEVVGMVEIDERPEELFLVNIKIVPNFQGKGVGAGVLRWMISRAANRHVPIRLQVLRANLRARRLYERLGFREIEQTEAYVHMELPATHATAD